MTDTASERWRYDALLLGAALAWGINVPLTKLTLREIDPLAFNALRFPLSVLVVWIFCLRESPGFVPSPRKGLWLRVVALGLAGHFLYQVTFVSGIDHTTAGHTALLISTSPLWVALLSSLVRIERLARGAWVGLGAAFLGACLIAMAQPASSGSLASAGDGDTIWLGNLLVLTAALMWAIYTVGSKPLIKELAPLRLAFLTMAVATPPMILVAWPAMADTDWAQLSWIVWVSVLFSGLMSSGFAYAVWNIGIRHVGPTHTAIYTNLVPVLALVLSFFWLEEVPLPLQLFGGVLVLAGLFAMRASRRPQREKAKPAPERIGD